MHEGVVLAFDFGTRRIGVAVGEAMLKSARPLTTIAAEANAARFDAIARLIDEWRPVRLVVGLPRTQDGAEHALGPRCRRFARQLAARFALPVELADERLSSVEAEGRLRELGRDLRRARADIDAEAAAVILQAYFERGANAAVRT